MQPKLRLVTLSLHVLWVSSCSLAVLIKVVIGAFAMSFGLPLYFWLTFTVLFLLTFSTAIAGLVFTYRWRTSRSLFWIGIALNTVHVLYWTLILGGSDTNWGPFPTAIPGMQMAILFHARDIGLYVIGPLATLSLGLNKLVSAGRTDERL